MKLEDQFKYLVSAYFGMMELDEYDLKVYVLKDIENYIRNFLEQNPIPNFNYQEKAKLIKEEQSSKTKLQNLLLVIPKINASTELLLLVKRKLKNYDK